MEFEISNRPVEQDPLPDQTGTAIRQIVASEALGSDLLAADLAEGLYRPVQFFRPWLVATEANAVSETATRRKDRAGHDTDILLQRLAVNAETIHLRR